MLVYGSMVIKDNINKIKLHSNLTKWSKGPQNIKSKNIMIQ